LTSGDDNIRTVWSGRVFDLNVEEATLPDGRKTVIEVIRHPGSSGIVPIQGPQSVILIRQFRPAVGRFIWEIPAGTMHPGEDPLECAKRELQEECGLMGQKFQKLGEIFIAPGYSDERIHLFMATNLLPSKQNLDEDELLTTHAFPFDQVMEMIEKGEIEDGMTIVGLQMAHAKLRGG
jgi:ADP-ribose pyrophosphatase